MKTENPYGRRSAVVSAALCLLALGVVQCGGGAVSNEASARRAYFGLDKAVTRALTLAFDGFNAASSANISPQTGMADVMGTMLVDGQVSNGMSMNREMRLNVSLTNYQDMATDSVDGGMSTPIRLTYDKPEDAGTPLSLSLSLRPGTQPSLTGTFSGTVRMSGELTGSVTIFFGITGEVRAVAGMGMRYERVPGTTRIAGTVMSSFGTYNVDIMR